MSSVLFLQGPLGPFFAKLARHLSRRGVSTHRINFNGGDRCFGWADYQVDFTGRDGEWPGFLRSYLREHGITAVLVYGDCRLYHRLARQVCKELGVFFGVFEEGYLRPDFVTLEWGGVNAYSGTDWSRPAIDSYRSVGRCGPSRKIGLTFWQRAWFAIAYYLSARFHRARFPHYQHHRNRDWKAETGCWLLSFWRKGLYKVTQRRILPRLVSNFSGRFFLFPLQTCDDFQIRTHSDLLSIEHSIDVVITSFAANAPPGELLVIKHHPMDRGFRHYGKLIDTLARQRGVGDRVVYGHDLHLPSLLKHARGVVTINSTVGISALLHGVPTKVLGRALYDMPGLTHQGDLHGFWRHPDPVDQALFRRFRTYLYERTQLDGSFFKYIDITVEAACHHLLPVIAAKPAAEAIVSEAAY
ncbi:capsule biosynthesis protein [Microbulbifer thermotolerans]|uniref:capsule biosynthesis protein n=1 Tax=Microbulbifer thermotolerans TaxID=252514 RepID=UPI00224A6325|nr:capsular biosynthesis protein [Microbulbifer thermotolerans]MCX2781145.1 capsular biosynthesis protein [Microbulbifer thermotolerans]MCX2804606.1 capsular biosynthesis protein [Microbulbifer thermotolerans]